MTIRATHIAAAILLLAIAVQTGRLHAEQRAHLRTKTGHAQTMQQLSVATAAAAQSAAAHKRAIDQALAAKDQQYTEELHHAQMDNQRLRAAVRAGTASVRIHGGANTSTPLPPTGSPRSLGDAATVTDAAVREDIFDDSRVRGECYLGVFD